MTFFKICIPDKYIFITISNKQEHNILTPAVHGNILTVNLIIQGKLSIIRKSMVRLGTQTMSSSALQVKY